MKEEKMSDCSCVWVPDNDLPSFFSGEQRKARKEHVCCECGEKIEVGQTYQYDCGKWEDDFGAFKTCMDCIAAREAFFCDGYAFESLWQLLSDHIREMRGQIKSDCLVGLPKKVRDRICDMIEEQWKDEQ
jgi:hypothetical protein